MKKVVLETEKKVFSKYSDKVYTLTDTGKGYYENKNSSVKVPVEWSVVLEISKMLVPLITKIFSSFDVRIPAFIKVEGINYWLTMRWLNHEGLKCQVGYMDFNGFELLLKNNLEISEIAKTEKQAKRMLRDKLRLLNII